MRVFVYYFISVIAGILMGISMLENSLIIFLIILAVTLYTIITKKFKFGLKISIVLCLLISFLNFVGYYQIDRKVENENFRIVSKTSKDVILKSSFPFSKKYIIEDFEKINDIKIGMLLNISGEIKEVTYYDIGVVGEIQDYKINFVKNDFIYKFINVRQAIKDFFVEGLGEKRGNILSALTFGDVDGLDKNYKNDLKTLGLVHILSVSGFHMNLIFSIVMKFLSVYPSLLVSLIYLFFIGTKVSGIRAFTMIFLKQLAPRVYKNYDGINALCFAGVLILLLRPYELFNLGFIYSFLATGGILIFNSKISRYLYKLPKFIGDPISLILSAQVLIFPVVILVERKLEFGFLLSNILLVPFYSCLIILGILLMCFGIIPVIKDLILYLITFVFDIIDGGIMFIKSITLDGIYLENHIIIFIICVYIIYFMSKKINFNKIKNIPVVLFMVYFIFINMVSLNIEVGKYFDKNYVIIRDGFKNYMYIDKTIKNIDSLETKLGIDKSFQNADEKDFKIGNNKLHIDFDGNYVLVDIDGEEIVFENYSTLNRYYQDIYPKKYYSVF